ncbi:MAG: 2-oxoacid:acceptor oxidoreductase subunit alpha [Staphylococcus epidermidis]|nr:2-oxoacid:acceptor oxidoreductase subunit alpha [Staphylococcus epidermidis]
MKSQISWKVGGQQGEGIESTGEIFATAMNRKGYFLYGYRHFSSRIKGGHTNNKIRVSKSPVHAISDDLDILIAFDQETIELNHHEMREDSIIIADAKAKPQKPENCVAQLIELPFTSTAKELGTALMKNMVAIGATSALMDLNTSTFETLIDNMFSKKGNKVVDMNIQALNMGYDLMKQQVTNVNGDFTLENGSGHPHLYMIGNDAIGLGAIAAGSRFMSAYPITPASEIMEYMIANLPKVDGTVVQTEDEIAAATMAIGANYAGVRGFTASAGPGLSLMMESIGLSGMTETPLVIINTQRGGPSTGLPTKQEQSDLMQMIYGTHGKTLDYNKIDIRRGEIIQSDIERAEDDKAYFKRYALTASGVSPRPIPGVKGGIHHVTGVEHNEEGKPSEAPMNRQNQMEKRMRKTESLVINNPVLLNEHEDEADILYIGFISTKGAIGEGAERLERHGVKVNTMHIRQLHPFPKDIVQQAINKASKVIVAEHNYQGQLSSILKMNTQVNDKLVNQTKYDGKPFLPYEIEEKGLEIAKELKELV